MNKSGKRDVLSKVERAPMPHTISGERTDGPMKLTEHRRRQAAAWLTYTGWWGALLLTVTDITIIQADPTSRVARTMGIVIVLFIGVGIAASATRSRMRLSDTIAGVFEAGLATAADNNSPPRPTCVMEADLDGVIRWVENPDVIHWERAALIGQSIVDLLPDRFREVHAANVAQLLIGDSKREVGPTLTLCVLTQSGQEITVQKLLSRLGECLIATITEVPTDSPPPRPHVPPPTMWSTTTK